MGKPAWFPRRVIDPAILWGAVTAFWLYFILAGFQLPLLLRLAVAAVWPLLLLAVSLIGAERGVRLDEEGIAVVPWFGAEQHYPWDTVHDVHCGSQSVTVLTSLGHFAVDDHFAGWRRFGRLVESRLSGEDHGQQVSRDEISELLGCDPDRGLVCTAPIRWLRLWPVGPAALFVAGGLWPVGLTLVVLSCLWANRDRRRHWVRADGHGLEIRRGRHELRLAWSEIDRVETLGAPYGRFYMTPHEFANDRLVRLYTDQGVIEWLYSDRRGMELSAAIERVLDARRAGRRLPDPGLVNNASLSVARLTGQETERSISRAEV